ncbi:MAG: HAD domain-containing protein [Casimicrobiaceae bacterium]
MTDPILFLDFDGVLHPASDYTRDPFCRSLDLAEALAESSCRVVISSSWRFGHSLTELRRRLPSPLANRICGCTGPAHIGRLARYREIVDYAAQCPTTMEWRALDDATWEFPEECPQLIACDPNYGVAGDQLRALRAWLNGAGGTTVLGPLDFRPPNATPVAVPGRTEDR